MVSFFKDKSTSAVFGVVFVCIVLHIFFLYNPPKIVTDPSDGLLFYVLSPFSQLPSIAVSVMYYAIVLVQAIRLNYGLNDARMFQKIAFTTALGYILLTALLPSWNNITAALVENSMIIWLIFRVTKLNNIQSPKSLIYNIGLITGSAGLLYFPSLGIVPVIFFALGVTRAFRPNEWFVLLMGVITPFYFWGCYLFLTGQVNTIKVLQSLFQWHFDVSSNIKLNIAFAAAGLLLIAGIYAWQANSNRMVIQVRKVWMVLFMMFLLFIPEIFFIKNTWPGALMLTCVPGAAFVSCTFLYSKRLVSAFFFWLMVAVIVYVNWLPFKI